MHPSNFAGDGDVGGYEMRRSAGLFHFFRSVTGSTEVDDDFVPE